MDIKSEDPRDNLKIILEVSEYTRENQPSFYW
jgi:hypothetical protein